MSVFRRVTIIVAFVAVVVVVLVLRDPGATDPDTDDEASAPSSSPTVSTLAPTPVPMEDFCTAFEAMAAAHSEHLGSTTPESLARVEEAGNLVLDLAPGTAMPPLALDALVYLVNGVLGVGAEPVPAEADAALATFLQSACPPSA